MKAPTDEYVITACRYAGLVHADQAACLNILRDGNAVDVGSAVRELPRAKVVVVARLAQVIVGIGAIKRVRSRYAAGLAKKARVDLHPPGSEVGYIAVGKEHWGYKLGLRILLELLSGFVGPVYATTDSPKMMEALLKAGFSEIGLAWRGARGDLSLWVRA